MIKKLMDSLIDLSGLRIKREKRKLKLNLLQTANYNLETSESPELLRAVSELLKTINQ